MGTSKVVWGKSKLILSTAPALTGTRRRHDSEDQSISIYKKHCLGHATQENRKTALLKKTLVEPGTSQALSPYNVGMPPQLSNKSRLWNSILVGFLILKDFLADSKPLAESNLVSQDPISAIHPPCIYAGDVASAMGFGLCRSKMMNGIVALHSPPMRKDAAEKNGTLFRSVGYVGSRITSELFTLKFKHVGIKCYLALLLRSNRSLLMLLQRRFFSLSLLWTGALVDTGREQVKHVVRNGKKDTTTLSLCWTADVNTVVFDQDQEPIRIWILTSKLTKEGGEEGWQTSNGLEFSKKLEEVQFLFDVVKAKDRYQRINSKVVVFTSGWRLDIQREWVIYRAGTLVTTVPSPKKERQGIAKAKAIEARLSPCGEGLFYFDTKEFISCLSPLRMIRLVFIELTPEKKSKEGAFYLGPLDEYHLNLRSTSAKPSVSTG
ncbi:putative cytochrome c biosynthesis protein [Capsicum chinense]|nr:putative cytochrome c biosynthesis protein [Capsicum chinense]